MEKEILEALKARFVGVSDAVLGRIARKLAKTATTSEQVKTAVEGVTLQQVIDSYADSRATEASETARRNAVADYETRHGLKDGVKVPSQQQEKGAGGAGRQAPAEAPGEDAPPAWARDLISRIDRMEASKTTETRRQQLDGVIGKLPETMRKAYTRLPLDKYSDDDFTALLSEVKTEVEEISRDTAASGAVFGKPTAGQGGGTKGELSEAQKAAISKRDGAPAEGAQPF